MSDTTTITIQNVSLALNDDWDLYVDNKGNLATVTGEDAVSQDCACAMKALLGEMIYQPTTGLPYFTTVWIQQNLKQWESAARATLLAVPGVVSINSFTYTVGDGSLNYEADIQTIYSQSLVLQDQVQQ